MSCLVQVGLHNYVLLWKLLADECTPLQHTTTYIIETIDQIWMELSTCILELVISQINSNNPLVFIHVYWHATNVWPTGSIVSDTLY